MPQIIHTISLILWTAPIFCHDLETSINSLHDFVNSNSSKEDVERLIEAKCHKNGASFSAFKNQEADLQACLSPHLNASTNIWQELQESQKTGSMDEVFARYCQKYPQIYGCLDDVIEEIRPCLDVAEGKVLNKSLEMLEKVKEFVCLKDGYRISIFIWQGGVECMEARKEELQECVNATVGMPTEMSMEGLQQLLVMDPKCEDLTRIRKCFYREMRKCNRSLPANVVDSFFKFVKKHLSCGGIDQSFDGEKNGSGGSPIGIATFLIVVAASFRLHNDF